jgi:hypothetical protein
MLSRFGFREKLPVSQKSAALLAKQLTHRVFAEVAPAVQVPEDGLGDLPLRTLPNLTLTISVYQ